MNYHKQQRPTFIGKFARRYALFGASFGFMFPIIATIIELGTSQTSPSLANAIMLHQANPLLLIIDTAPLFLGLFALLAGVRQDATQNANEVLRTNELALQKTNDELERFRDELEQRVARRTEALEEYNRQLRAVAKVARAVAAIQEPDRLLPLVTEVVSEEFGYYHTAIFLLDSRLEYAVLQAANSDGGKRMLKRGHRLRLGTTGIVGYTASKGQARIALDVEADSAFFNNPDLPATRSEMALPLKVGGQTIGILDVQSTEMDAFKERDIEIITILANQIAVAIENARLFTQTKQALSDSQAIYEQYVRQDWARFVGQIKHVGYVYDGIRATPLSTAPQALEDPTGFTIPVRVRGQHIGMVSIHSSDPQRKWLQSDISIAQAAADRAALAIENVRLLTEAQRRAAKERTIADITSKVGASIKVEGIMQSAVEELGRALPGSEIVLQFSQLENPA